jgi:hypothetical protein
MTISTLKVVDNNFHIIVNSNGVGNEINQKLIDVVNSNNASSEPKVSIASIAYEILGTGEVTVFFENDNTKEVVLSGLGNYGLKPGEEKIKDVVGNILLDSDSNVIKYNLVIEAHKESGYN